MPLTELMVKQAKPEDKPYTMADGNGLILEVRPQAAKYWIVHYWKKGKERRKSLGPYPEVSLKAARDQNIDLRRALKTGKPNDAETFASVAEEWFKKRVEPSISQKHTRTIRFRLDSCILSVIGGLKMSKVTSSTPLGLCRKIEERSTIETTNRVKLIIGQVFRYAIATDRADHRQDVFRLRLYLS